MASKQKNLSVLMFPWLGHGHICPYLELGKKLAQRNFTIYLCSTLVNLKSIEKMVGFDDSSIRLIELKLPVLSKLPPHYHTTNGLPPHLMNTLKKAFDMSKHAFMDILKKWKPDLLVYDFLQPWAPEAAFMHDIPAVQFITSSTTMTTVLFHAYKRPDVEFPFPDIYFREYESTNEQDLRKSAEDHKKGGSSLVISCIEKSSKVILIKGFNEIEGKYIKYLSTLCGKKVVPVGPLVQEPAADNIENESLEIIKWLDKKEKASTVFVSFGTEYFLSDEDFEAIAQGLLQSEVNFIWSVRFPLGENISLVDKLQPLGFYEKVGDRGMVVEGWVPQAKILGHSSIGGFVSHCGWNSVLESMKFGVPIIAMPMHIDQPINARLVEEVGAGIEVLRSQDKKFQAGNVASVIRRVVVTECGKFVRTKVKELSYKIAMKRDEEIDEVAKELEKVCVKGKPAVMEERCTDLVKFVGSGLLNLLVKPLKNLPQVGFISNLGSIDLQIN
ncbi:Glycosyltransferase [Heracleum sosnowskyi]|uniref:Glycosyltransferase n=1 Tax=Heracleum sosnowskyi TaxID=360622 RepID=A0AAD8N222_9APIA|nr:Glycosyltransferase [Heracleum sosnowskyi]